MLKFLEILFTMIKMIVVIIAFCIEVPVKIAAMALFLMIFIISAFFAPLFSKITSPKWWDMLCDYCMHPLKFKLVKWVNEYYDY